MSEAPVLLQYQGEGEFRPARRFWAERCDKQFVIGEEYRMAPVEERSDVSHRHEFAWLREAWKQIPESVADLYPTPEHLRKRALIQAGWYNEEAIDAGTNAAALRVAATFRKREEFSLVIVRGPAVLIRTAKSQSRRAMQKDEFQRSKTAMMEVVAEMIEVDPATLQANAGQAA